MPLSKLDLAKSDKAYYTAGNTPCSCSLIPCPICRSKVKARLKAPFSRMQPRRCIPLPMALRDIARRRFRILPFLNLKGNGGLTRSVWFGGSERGMALKLLIRMPAFVTSEIVDSARDKAFSKKNHLEPIQQVVLETIHEGLCVQIMHIGPTAQSLIRWRKCMLT